VGNLEGPKQNLFSRKTSSKSLQNPMEIICHTCALMRYWAGLFGEADQETLLDGVNTMLKIAVKLLANPKQKDKKKLRITPSGRRRWQ
jgi:hypothetical protein